MSDQCAKSTTENGTAQILQHLATRAVNCKSFRWLPGMRCTAGSRVLHVDDRGVPVAWTFETPDDLPRLVTGYGTPGWCADCWANEEPDFGDPATRGLLHELLPDGWYLVPILVDAGSIVGWVVYRPTDDPKDRPVTKPQPSRVAALVAALEVAP